VITVILIVSFLGLVVLASALLTAQVRKLAIAGERLDRPNERSLHGAPIPRGGGLAFAIVSILVWCLLAVVLSVSFATLVGLILPLSILVLTGWLDDKHNLKIPARLFAQLLASVLALILLGELDQIEVAGITLNLSWLAWPATVLWIIWLVNLYNFMDGIDGIASVQGIVAATTMGIWYGVRSETGMGLICFVLAAAVTGFLYYNWPPAKIFMGDTGSLFLGGFFSIQTIIATVSFGIPFDAILILLSVFLADASVTLVHRMLRGEKWWQAHRSHFYQRAVQSNLSHATVSLSVLLLSIVLALFATMRAMQIGQAWIWLVLAVFVLIACALAVTHRESMHSVSLND